MALTSAVWRALCGAVWCCVALCGAVWRCVALCGVVWRCVAPCGAVWRCVALCGVVWRCMVHCGTGWHCVAPREAAAPLQLPDSRSGAAHHLLRCLSAAHRRHNAAFLGHSSFGRIQIKKKISSILPQ